MWNLRLVRYIEDDETFLEVREVFYDTDGNPYGHTDAIVCGENLEEIDQYLDWMHEALERPILDEEDFNGNPYKEEKPH